MLDFFFPIYCINCGCVGSYLCPQCKKMLKNNLPECYICRKVSNGYVTHKECNTNKLDKVFVGWEYGNIPKKILSQYKYRYAYKLSEILSTILIQRLEITGFSKNINKNTILVPIPIHYTHKKDRGFNQSLLLANLLSKHFRCEIKTNVIKRIGNHNYQSQQNLKERLSLNEEIFEIQENIIGKNIVLIDDVISTGTTLNRACNKLEGNSVCAITLFRGKPHYQYLRE